MNIKLSKLLQLIQNGMIILKRNGQMQLLQMEVILFGYQDMHIG